MFPAPWSQEMNLKYRTTVNQERGLETFGRTSLVAQVAENPLAVEETQVRSLRLEDPLEKGMATHSGILAWEVPVDKGEPGVLQSVGSQRIGHD